MMYVVFQGQSVGSESVIDLDEDRITGTFSSELAAREWADRHAWDPWCIFPLHDSEQ